MRSFRPPGSVQKVDLKSMQTLLEMGDYQYKEERGLDLYYKDQMKQKPRIVVLDNDLPLYCTTIEDVAMRKNPTIKEMVSIRKAFRILNDKDVLLAKREETLETVKKEAIALLNLSYTESDLAFLEKDGAEAFRHHQVAGVLETIDLFAEILHYERLPKGMLPENLTVVGLKTDMEGEKTLWGPLVVYHAEQNGLKLIVDQFDHSNPERLQDLLQKAEGIKTADLEGPAVFDFLKKRVLTKKQQEK
jgi:glycerophosphoryl diester phosphodiesterase